MHILLLITNAKRFDLLIMSVELVSFLKFSSRFKHTAYEMKLKMVFLLFVEEIFQHLEKVVLMD